MIKKVREFRFDLTAFSADSDWGRCMSSYLVQIQRKSGSINSQHHYCANLEHFFSIEPRREPQFYTREDVESFITSPSRANLRQGPVANGTVNNRIVTLSSWYKYAASYGVRGDDGMMYPLFKYLSPTAGVMRAPKTIAPYKALNPTELRAFFSAIPRDSEQGRRDYALFSCFFLLSRRNSEILTMRWKDIEPTVFVGENGSQRSGWQYHWRGKGHSNQDDVSEMPQEVYNRILDYLQYSGKLKTIQPDDPIFTTCTSYWGQLKHDPHRRLDGNTVSQLAKNYAVAASLDPAHVCVHSFRHTSARELYRAGLGVREIQTRLRHKSLETTDWYLRQLTRAECKIRVGNGSVSLCVKDHPHRSIR